MCFGCNTRLNRGEYHLCTVCRNHLPLTEYSFNVENAVDRIFYGRINIKKANSFLFFIENGIVKNLIHHLKYKNQEQIGTFLGDWHGQIIAENNYIDPRSFTPKKVEKARVQSGLHFWKKTCPSSKCRIPGKHTCENSQHQDPNEKR